MLKLLKKRLPMKVLELDQNTPEWKLFRRTKIGASDCAGILCKTGYVTARGVYEQKIYGDETHENPDIKRGRALEETARYWISEKDGIPYRPVCVQSDEREWQIASLDGYHFDGEKAHILEIKAPRKHNLKKIKKSGIPEYWQWQLQHQLSVTGCDSVKFLAYSEEEQVVLEVKRDEGMIDHLNEMESIFYHDYVCAFIEPPYDGLVKESYKLLYT